VRRLLVVGVVAGVALAVAGPAVTRTLAPGQATAKVAFLQGEQVVLFERRGATIGQTAAALLAGPTAAERAKGARTAIPARTPLRGVSLSGSVATIDLGERFALGTQADSLNARLVQVVLTLTAVRGVRYVRVLVKGGVPLGLFPAFPASQPLTAKSVRRPAVAPPKPPPGSSGPTTEETRALQQRLAELGFLDPAGVDGREGPRTRAAVLGFQKWQRLARDGAAGPATRQALATAVPPTPRLTGGGTRAEVLLDRQVTLLVRDGRVVRAFGVSTGMPGFATPPGEYVVFRKETRSWSVPYEVWLPWASYFVGGIAFHESPDVPAGPASHGCVRVPAYDAEWLYRQLPNGTRVSVLARS
jgi:L,D-transpeptidase catalytic domain/Putative peptidoglycan binding domain/Sporulation and spore germination